MTNNGMARRGFGNNKPPAILKHLKRLYITPSLQDINQALLRLHNQMDCNQPVEVMLRTTEEVKIFPMDHLDGDC